MGRAEAAEPRLDATNQCVWLGERRVDLAANAYRLLEYLASRPQQLVTKDELLEAVWPDAHVIDAVLSVAISQIRQALDDDPRRPRYVETVHRRGYRWIGKLASPAAAAPATPLMFGRSAALAELRRALDEAESGRRQFVFVTGDPGIGKTTVVDAFLAELAASNGSVQAARGQCVDTFGAGEPCMPLLEALEQLCRDSPRTSTVLREVAPTWLLQLAFLLDPSEADDLRRRLAASSNERMVREWQRAVEALATTSTLVLALEDLHWADSTTIAMLAALAARRDRARVLVVGTYRPVDAIAEQHPVIRLRHDLRARRQGVEIALEGLDASAVGDWLGTRFPRNAFPDDLAVRLHRQTSGNPLFLLNAVEHMEGQGWLQAVDGVWECRDDVDPERTVADGTRAMIDERLARLPRETLALLEAASLIGMTFPSQLLASAAGRDAVDVERECSDLVRSSRFLADGQPAHWPDGSTGASYAFRHALYRQVLEDRVTPARRRECEMAITNRLEQGYGASASEIAVTLAVHCERAGDFGRAVTYRKLAATVALGRYSYDQTSEHLHHALSLLAKLPPSAERDERELEICSSMLTPALWNLGIDSADLARVAERAEALSSGGQTTPVMLQSLSGLVSLQVMQGRVRDAEATARRFAERFAAAFGEGPLAGVGTGVLGTCQFLLGRLVEARANLEPSLRLPPMGGLTPLEPSIIQKTDLGVVCALQGDLERGLRLVHEGFDEAVASGHSPDIVYTGDNALRIGVFLGDDDLVERSAAALGDISDRLVTARWAGQREIGTGWLRGIAGDQAGIDLVQHGRAMQIEYIRAFQVPYAIMAAELLLRFGRSDEAAIAVSDAEDLLARHGEDWCRAEVHRMRGQVVLAQAAGAPPAARQKALEEATRHFNLAIADARRRGARLWELKAAVSLVRAREGRSPALEAREICIPVRQWFDADVTATEIVAARALLGTAG